MGGARRFDMDVICIVETHVENNIENQPFLRGYIWFGHCRGIRHVNANRTHGGVGVFVKEKLFEQFDVSVLDNTYGGILCLLFKDKGTEFCFTVYCCYLPPENSPYGRDSTGFFAHLLSQIYLNTYVDAPFICDDLQRDPIQHDISYNTAVTKPLNNVELVLTGNYVMSFLRIF